MISTSHHASHYGPSPPIHSLPSLSLLPSYQSPLTLSPSLPPQLDACCEISHRQRLIHRASLTSYGQLWVEPYKYERQGSNEDKDLSGSESENIARIVLEFDGSVSGIQYDRFGAVWVHGVELLRTSTPEPPGDNKTISWSVTRDVTDYASILLKEEEVYAAVSIPNVVNNEYTGAIEINCTLVFYASKSAHSTHINKKVHGRSPSSGWPAVMNLNSNFAEKLLPNLPSPWSVLSVMTNANQNHTLKRSDIPSDVLTQPASLGRVYLDVFASAHECEEFYYTNLPSSLIPENETSACGGGPIRIIQVMIDGQLAGAMIPFPTVYTGGINPMLWRPLTGIESFDVVPYRFDLTPFLGKFHEMLAGVDGSEIEIGLQILTGEGFVGTVDEGVAKTHNRVWYLDSTLKFFPQGGTRERMSSYDSFSIITHHQPLASVGAIEDIGCNVSLSNSYKFSILASSTITGRAINISYEIDSYATLFPGGVDVLTLDEGHAISHGTSRQTVTTASTQDGKLWLQRVSSSGYNFFANTTDTSDSATFDLRANVKWSRERSEEYISYGAGMKPERSLQLNARWVNSVAASGRYNRSLADHDGVHIAEGHSDESFLVSSIMDNELTECYKAEASATNGSVVIDGHEVDKGSLTFDFDCRFPPGILFCGQELCGLLDFESRFWASAHKGKEGRDDGNGKSSGASHPRHSALRSFLFIWLVFLVLYAAWAKSREGGIFSRANSNDGGSVSPLSVAFLSDQDNQLLMTRQDSLADQVARAEFAVM